MPIVAGLVLLGCAYLAYRIMRARQGEREYERDPEVEEALERLRESLRRPLVVVAGAVIVELLLIAILVRNPSRWPLMLFALAVIGGGVTVYLIAERRRQ